MTSHARFPIALAAALAALAAPLAPVPARAIDLHAHGLLDLCLSSGAEAFASNRLTQGDSNFDPWRARIMLDAEVAPGLDVYLQSILSENGWAFTADGAYAQWTPWRNRDAHLQAGKIPWPIGAWASRTYSDRNPLIGMPLIDQYHTSLAWEGMPGSVDELVAAAGTGQSGVPYANNSPGMAVLDDRWWDVGVVAIGSQRPLEYAIGVIQGSPGWPVPGADVTPGQTTLGRLGLAPLPGVRFGVSGAWGTWMPWWFGYGLPAGRSLRDYHEGLGMADAEWMRGPLELRAEGAIKTWQTITTGTLRVWGGHAEARLSVGPGVWLAARYGELRFGDVTTSGGVTRPWDDGVDRLEAGIGWRATRDVQLKAAFQRDVTHPYGDEAYPADLFALAASIRL